MTNPPAAAPAVPDTLADVLRDARQRFIANFPGTCASIETLIAQAGGPEGAAALASLQSVAHKLTGLAGTVGFPDVSREASRLEALVAQRENGPLDTIAAARALSFIRDALQNEPTGVPVSSIPEPAAGPNGETILVVEDEADQCAIMMGALRHAGYAAVEARSGDLVLAAARQHKPAAIVLDIALPGLDGFSVCRELKAAPDLSSIPVIFATTGPNLDDRLMGLWLGADEFLTKPVDMRELVLRIKLAVNRARAVPPGSGPTAAPMAPAVVPMAPAVVPAAVRLVLVAEDDPDVAQIIDAQMRAAGYRTLIASDGAQALVLLAQAPDLLVLDLMLPILTGFEVLGSLSQMARPFRILVLSARAREDDVTRAFGLGADDFMAKPFSPPELRARVARLLR